MSSWDGSTVVRNSCRRVWQSVWRTLCCLRFIQVYIVSWWKRTPSEVRPYRERRHFSPSFLRNAFYTASFVITTSSSLLVPSTGMIGDNKYDLLLANWHGIILLFTTPPPPSKKPLRSLWHWLIGSKPGEMDLNRFFSLCSQGYWWGLGCSFKYPHCIPYVTKCTVEITQIDISNYCPTNYYCVDVCGDVFIGTCTFYIQCHHRCKTVF